MLNYCNDNLQGNADCYIKQHTPHCRLVNESSDCCHPNLRKNFECTPVIQNPGTVQLEETFACDECSIPKEEEIKVMYPCEPTQSLNICEQACKGHNKEFHCITHTCPLGKIVSCTDCTQEDPTYVTNFCHPEVANEDHSNCYHVPNIKENPINLPERTCCEKNISFTEPGICACSEYNPEDSSKPKCLCECGGSIGIVKGAPCHKKKVRFADEVKDIDCDKVFESIEPKDAKDLCRCCQECLQKGKDPCIGRPVLVYDVPEPKLEGTSVSQKDFCWHKTPMKEMPPWHPNIKDRWSHMDVPSMTDTTYQHDFKPPTVTKEKRRPVYLAPRRIERDPCQQLAEEYTAWKKTSEEQDHVHHSNCPNCDKYLHRVHLHECDTRFLPEQYRCHGDGHVGDNIDAKFTLCETGDTGRPKFWWRRTCCATDKQEIVKSDTLSPNLLKSECPTYITSYKHDYKHPYGKETKFVSEDCNTCKYFQRAPNDLPVSLCTTDPNQPLITQRGGII